MSECPFIDVLSNRSARHTSRGRFKKKCPLNPGEGARLEDHAERGRNWRHPLRHRALRVSDSYEDALC